jgi:hypothetical protein
MVPQRKVVFLLSFFCAVAIVSLSAPAQNDLQIQKAAIVVITDTADKICNQAPPLQGQGNSVELSGQAKAALNDAITKVVDLGIEGAGKYNSDQHAGLLRQDLASVISGNTNCRLAVFNALSAKLLGNAAPQNSAAPRSQTFRVCAGNGGGNSCVAGADGYLTCADFRAIGARGAPTAPALGDRFCGYTEGGSRKLPPYKVVHDFSIGGGECGWTQFHVICNP